MAIKSYYSVQAFRPGWQAPSCKLATAQWASTREVDMLMPREGTKHCHSEPVSSISSTISLGPRPAGRFIGRTESNSAVTPEAIGAAIEVPDHIPYRPPGRALMISSPGATLRTHRPGPPPAFAIVENEASVSRRVLAPTLSKLSS
jgi:hypothetical protein